jgi:cell division protein ZapE
MSLLEAHQLNIAEKGFQPDAAQIEVARVLDIIHDRLLKAGSESVLSRFWKWLQRGSTESQPTGLYLWGGVGRGKTYLMDLFFEHLPFEDKLRMHFHRFMLRVHMEMTALAGTVNPLETVADHLAAQGRVLCFDEFFIEDVADAMILGELLGALFDRGVTLVATSNVEPSRLYENGLQRRRFLPVIERIDRHMRVMHLDGGLDYRLRVLTRANIYHWPSSDRADLSLEECFGALAPGTPTVGAVIEVNGRKIQTRQKSDDVVWFDFVEICDGPRGQNDYIELSREFHAVVISGVPRFEENRDDQARRFISLIDEFYDRNVKVVLSAEVAAYDLYRGQRLRLEFERTSSRLLEMQSLEYLRRSHRP